MEQWPWQRCRLEISTNKFLNEIPHLTVLLIHVGNLVQVPTEIFEYVVFVVSDKEVNGSMISI